MASITLLLACSEKPDAPQHEINHVDQVPNINTPKGDQKSLDLSLPNNPEAKLGESYDFSEKKVLPNLFEDKKKEEDISLGGKMLTDPEQEVLAESVNGAQLNIEIKTK